MANAQCNIKSMTGYGKGEKITGEKKITVEIRTLNSKQMDLSIKLPSIYREREFEIRNNITKALLRGKTDVFINVELINNKKSTPINADIFKSYYDQIESISSQLGFDLKEHGIANYILRLPDVLQCEKAEVPEEEWNALMEAVQEAIGQTDKFRLQEGTTLIGDILKRIDKIEKLKNDIIPYEKERIELIRNRIRENIETMKIPVDENRFEQEIIYYLEKLDITEEKVRMQNHINYFREVCEKEEAPGRKLGFIAQELGREINTTGSKANNSDIQKLVVGMKDELEKIKEQSLNLL